MSSVDEIKARLDIIDIVSENVQLRRTGKNYTGFCPFHPNTRTPAFVVFPETGTWRCFGQCNEGGDLINYVMKREGWDFPEALKHLADRAGVVLRPISPEEQGQKEEHERLRNLLEDAVAFFRHHLINTEAGKPALNYLHERNLSDKTIEEFELGYSPHSWDQAHTHFTEKGYTEKDLVDAGLVTQRDSGGIYDRFRNRLMFPIRNYQGKMAGFGARALAPDDVPKYLNSPQTPIFDKSNLLYGLDKSRKGIRADDQVVIVEGYMDVIATNQAGFKNLVASMGTALTEEQLRQLKRLTRKIILAMDSDAAGVNATLRGLQVARNTLDRESELTFDARGLLRNEARLNADIRVSTLPEGLDPDEIVNENPEEWAKLIASAKPVVVHVMETLAASQDLSDPKAKTEVADQVMPLIQDVPSLIERDTYRQQLARLLKVDESTLVSSYQQPVQKRRRPGRRAKNPVDQSAEPVSKIPEKSPLNEIEAMAVGMILRKPENLYRVDRALIQSGLARISNKDFMHTNHQEIISLIITSLDQDAIEPQNYVIEQMPIDLADYADDLLQKTQKLVPQEERILSEIFRNILRLRENVLRDMLNQYRFQLEDEQENNSGLNDDLMQEINKVNQQILKINKAFNDRTLFSNRPDPE